MQSGVRLAARPWVAPLARTGHATKGVVYVLVGGLAVLAAAGQGGKVSGSEGAVRTIGEQPFGRLLLVAAAVGLCAYALYRLLQAALNLEGDRGAKGAYKRLGFAFSGLAYGALAFLAVQLVRGRSHRGPGTRGWAAEVLAQPLGEVLIGGVGLVLIGHGLFQLYSAVVAKFPERLDTAAMGPTARTWGVRVGRFGLAARGVVFGIIGYHLVKAALSSSASGIRDFGGVLREIGSQPNGRVMLGVVAAGLAAYGLYMFVCARWARIAGGKGG
jgi:hypothetical protein